MLPVFDLADGPSVARGELFGRLSTGQVGHSLATYRGLLPALTGQSWTQLAALAGPMVHAARAFDASLIDDLHGVAIGADVAFDDIAVLCARSELLQLATATPVGECTTVARDARIGQTWDWFVDQLVASLIWRTPRFVAFAEAGMPPKIGVNADGVAVTLNFLETRLAVDPDGLAVHTLLHHVLERATSTADAVQRLLAAPAAGCAAIGVLDPRGDAAIVELAPHGRSVVAQVELPLFQTNHCLSAELAGLDTPGLLFDNSTARLARARALGAEGATIERILSDDDGGWHPIALVPTSTSGLGAQLGTVAAVVIDVHLQTLTIAPGNPSASGFIQTVSLVPA